MSIFDRFFPKADIEFAHQLADKIAKHFPPSGEVKLAKQGGQRRLGGVVETVFGDLDTWKGQARPGWIRKARLGNAFRWRLVELGYSKEFVEALTEGVVTHLSAQRS
jgi:hypothetical protein